MIEQQAEVERLADDQEKQRKLAKNFKYKAQLEAQLSEKNNMNKLEQQLKHHPIEQKTLEENYMKFEKKEFDRVNNGRERNKGVMIDNKYHIIQKQNERTTLDQQDRDVFNRQALEDKLHAERNEDEKRRFKDWQREALKHDYEKQIKRKEQLGQMEKIKETDYAQQYKNSVETFENNNHRTLETLRERNGKIMKAQQETYIPDTNDQRKQDAVSNMKKQFENTEKETLRNELERLNKKSYETKETTSVLKQQMDHRVKKHQTEVNDDQFYKSYVDNTVNLLSERDRKIKEDRERLKKSYAKELENQIKEHQTKEKTIFNEMDDKVLKLNQRNLISYEVGEKKKDMFRLPGLNRDENDAREYFGRYSKEQKTNQLAAELGLGLKIGENQSHTSRKPISVRRDSNGLGNSFKKYQIAPKTSTEEGATRRGRGIQSPNYNILNNQNMTDGEYEPKRGLAKYQSMTDISAMNPYKSAAPASIEPVKTEQRTLLSPKTREAPAYEPTKRESNQRRSLADGGVSKSVSQLNTYRPAKEVAFEAPKHNVPQFILKPRTDNKFDKIKKVPESLIDVNKLLNNRIMGSLRNGNLGNSSNFLYGQKQNMPGYKGPIG